MKTMLLAIALIAGSAGIAAADGWIDCNGPDKNGRGCTAGTDGATIGTTLALVALVTSQLGRRRKRRS